jgi:hypothetical protein
MNSMKRYFYRIYFSLAVLIGAGAAARSLYSFDTGQLDPSRLRLLFAGSSAMLALLFAGGLAFMLLAPGGERRLDRFLEARLIAGRTWLNLATLLSVGALVSATAILVWRLPLFHTYHWYAARFPKSLLAYEIFLTLLERSQGLLSYLCLLCLAGLALLFTRFGEAGRRPGAVSWRAILQRALVVGMVVFSLFHWMVLISQATFFSAIPGWYWESLGRGFSPNSLWFLLLAGFALGTAALVIRKPKAIWSGLILIYLAGLVLQFGFGAASGEGVEWVRMKYAGSFHRSYATFASQEELNPGEVIREYEARYGQRMFPSTKPPGVILTYVLTERISHLFRPESSGEGRFLALTTFMAYVFPFLSFFIIGVLAAVARRLDGQPGFMLPALLYVLLPNVILIPVFLDQVFYPLLFLGGAWLMIEAVQRGSLWMALSCGLYFYTAIFFSFSMLPLLPFFLALLGLDFIRDPKWNRAIRALKLAAAVFAGILVVFVFLKLVFGYDVITRYTIATRVVRNYDFLLRTNPNSGMEVVDPTGETVRPGLGQVLNAARLNLVEFAAACGFPVFLLFLSRSLGIALAFLRRKTSWQDRVLGAFLLTFLALNAYGQMQGEVSRLWLFWTPVVVLFAGVELRRRFAMRPAVIYLVVALQWITLLLTFQFQDFIV